MKHQRIDFTHLPEASRRALFEEATASWTEIFGTPPSDLEGYWFETKSRQTYLHTMRDDDGRLVGTLTVKYYDVHHRGRDIVIMKLGVGMLSGARGRSMGRRCALWELVANFQEFALRDVHFFSTIIHPIPFHIVTGLLDSYYPHYDRPQEPELEQLAHFLAEYFGLTKSTSASAFVYREARVSLETEAQRRALRARSSPAIEFYLRECPDYASGDCLTILAPLSLRVLASVMARAASSRAGKWWRAMAPSVASAELARRDDSP